VKKVLEVTNVRKDGGGGDGNAESKQKKSNTIFGTLLGLIGLGEGNKSNQSIVIEEQKKPTNKLNSSRNAVKNNRNKNNASKSKFSPKSKAPST
jgi:hypothetical protein